MCWRLRTYDTISGNGKRGRSYTHAIHQHTISHFSSSYESVEKFGIWEIPFPIKQVEQAMSFDLHSKLSTFALRYSLASHTNITEISTHLPM